MYKSCEEIAAQFDSLPDDSVVPATVYDILFHRSRETRRRNPPERQGLRRIQLAANRWGYRVGDLRKLIRGELVAS
jgi:hypothetical protein